MKIYMMHVKCESINIFLFLQPMKIGNRLDMTEQIFVDWAQHNHTVIFYTKSIFFVSKASACCSMVKGIQPQDITQGTTIT